MAAPTFVGADEIRVGGSVSSAFQLRLGGCGSPELCRFLNFRNANVVQLTIEGTPSATTELKADVSVRNINFTEIQTLEDTGEIDEVAPVDIRVNEARLSLFDLFGARGLDLHAGALRVEWGTADGVSPADRVNPFDLEDATGYERRLATPAIQIGYNVGDLTIEAVVVPIFMPAILPVDHIDFTSLGDPSDVFQLTKDDADPPEVNEIDAEVDAPEPALENVQVGARIKYKSPIGDFSAMFFRGFESLPQASGAVILTGFQTQDRIDLQVPLVYPRTMMAAADFRGPIVGELSGWFELAVMFPERHELTVTQSQLEALVSLGELDAVPDPIPRQETQSDEVYVNAVAGLDYLAWDMLYINLQYLRGMPTERQASDIHDYLLLALRLSLLDGRLVFAAQGAFEIAAEDSFGYSAGGSVSWLHGDAARIILATTFMDGDSATTFGRFATLSNLRLSFWLGF